MSAKKSIRPELAAILGVTKKSKREEIPLWILEGVAIAARLHHPRGPQGEMFRILHVVFGYNMISIAHSCGVPRERVSVPCSAHKLDKDERDRLKRIYGKLTSFKSEKGFAKAGYSVEAIALAEGEANSDDDSEDSDES